MTQRFEAVVLRFVPDAGAGEALNVGVAVRTLDGHFFDLECLTGLTRITGAFPDVHPPTVRAACRQLGATVRKALGDQPLPLSTLTEELRRAAPDPDGALQWSDPIQGVTADPRKTFEALRARYVDRHTRGPDLRLSRTDAEVEDRLLRAFRTHGVAQRLLTHELRSPAHKTFSREFKHCWENGKWNCVEPLSLDLLEPRSIQDKVSSWIGNVRVLSPSAQRAQIILYVGLPSPDVTVQQSTSSRIST